MNVWFISLILSHFCILGISSDGVKYFPVETQSTYDSSSVFPLEGKRVYFGLKSVNGDLSALCPRIIFSSNYKEGEKNANLQLYFCQTHYGIASNYVSGVLKEEKGKTIRPDAYTSLWFEIDSSNSTISFGHKHNPVSIFTYDFTADFNESTITHYGLAGSGRWLLESEKQNLTTDTRDVGRSTAYFPLSTKKIRFAVQTAAKAKWCPKIILSNRVDSSDNTVSFSVILCRTSIALQSARKMKKIVQQQNLISSDSMKYYWLVVDQMNSLLSLGEDGNEEPIFTYDVSDHFNTSFMEYLSVAGSGHWTIDFSSGKREYFSFQTHGHFDSTIGYQLTQSRLYFAVQQSTDLSTDCPMVKLSSKPKNRADKPNLSIYFCYDAFGILDGEEALPQARFRNSLKSLSYDEYKNYWIEVNERNGTVLLGWTGQNNAFYSYSFGEYDLMEESFLGYFAFGGSGKWIMEKDQAAYIKGESMNDTYSTTFYPLESRKIFFGLKPLSTNSLSCPRIQFQNKAERDHKPVLGIFFCKNTFGVFNGSENLIEKNGSLLYNDGFTSYWIELDQISGTLSMGERFNSTAFFEYSFRNSFKKQFFSHFTFVGYTQFIVTQEDEKLMKKNLITQQKV